VTVPLWIAAVVRGRSGIGDDPLIGEARDRQRRRRRRIAAVLVLAALAAGAWYGVDQGYPGGPGSPGCASRLCANAATRGGSAPVGKTPAPITAIRHAGRASQPHWINGWVSALSSKSISIGPTTCSRTSSSPGLPDLSVGAFVGQAVCLNGRFAANGLYERRGTALRVNAFGHIERLSSTWITVDGLSCSLGATSPSAQRYRIGEPAVVSCGASGVLTSIARSPSPYSGFNFALGTRGKTATQVVAQLSLMASCRRAGERLIPCMRRGHP
jgi:hypothetical protein